MPKNEINSFLLLGFLTDQIEYHNHFLKYQECVKKIFCGALITIIIMFDIFTSSGKQEQQSQTNKYQLRLNLKRFIFKLDYKKIRWLKKFMFCHTIFIVLYTLLNHLFDGLRYKVTICKNLLEFDISQREIFTRILGCSLSRITKRLFFISNLLLTLSSFGTDNKT